MNKKKVTYDTQILAGLMAIFIFIALNIPSLKLIYSSMLINVIALLGIWGVGILRFFINPQKYNLTISKDNIKYLVLFIIFWTILFLLTFLNAVGTLSISNLIEYISIILLTLGSILFVLRTDLKYILYLQLIWGLILSLLEFFIGIPKNEALGQHYLTSGVPIGLSIVMAFGYLYTHKTDKRKIITMFLCLVIYLLGITSLPGRAPILLSIIIPTSVILISLIITRNNFKNLLVVFGSVVSIVVFLREIIVNFISDYTIYRFMNLFESYQDEPRYGIYKEAWQIFLENPFGLGLKGYSLNTAIYPHNIILETLLSGGLLAMIPLVIIIVTLFVKIIKDIREEKVGLVFGLGFLFIFFTWNISFELTSSYMLFVIIALYLKSEELSIKNPWD